MSEESIEDAVNRKFPHAWLDDAGRDFSDCMDESRDALWEMDFQTPVDDRRPPRVLSEPIEAPGWMYERARRVWRCATLARSIEEVKGDLEASGYTVSVGRFRPDGSAEITLSRSRDDGQVVWWFGEVVAFKHATVREQAVLAPTLELAKRIAEYDREYRSILRETESLEMRARDLCDERREIDKALSAAKPSEGGGA